MSDLETTTQPDASSTALITSIIEDLFSYSTIRRRRILEYYFFPDAVLTSPVMSTEGVLNIQYVYTVWQALNRQEPTITNIVFDGRTAVVHLTQHLSPCIFPRFVRLQVPAITTLHFRETERDSGLLKIYKQEDSWTVEGLIQSVPLVSFWYNHVLRVVMGKLVTTTGDLLDAAFTHARRMSLRGREIQRVGRDMAVENMERLEKYRTSLHENYIDGVRGREECYIQELDVPYREDHPDLIDGTIDLED
ncbi:hypothetical protein DFQ28_000788 [Apophysomyces sp. BC1034]|nr:hypothetical protein DFQ30_000162 [Apophysomyces sp. BC1015]KAG0181376.1 hypothetical protein DFQ29_008514 [Apophysomyces sp. BC1021]KAG0191185.1 hypothetical protein DFQ28_000788 [Apophysomyces sp. BC1034]